MIKKLTKAQEKKIPEYLQKWLDVGYRTSTIDQEKAKESVNFIYTDILDMDKPKYYIFLDSPMACQLAINLVKGLDSIDTSQLSSQLNSQLRSQLYSQLGSQLDSQLDSQLGSQLRSQLDSQLGSQLYSQLGNNYYYESCSNINPRWYYFWTHDFILNELFKDKVKDFHKFNSYMNSLKELHLTYMFKDIVFFSNFPEHIKLDKDNNLHSTDNYSLKYRDNYGLFSVHGEVKYCKRILKTKLSTLTYGENTIQDGDYYLLPEM